MPYLSGPVNTLADFQLEYAGLLLGDGTPFECPPVWSFLDSAPIRSMDTARAWGDGSWSGPDFADAATWQMPIEIAATAGIPFPDAVRLFESRLAIAAGSRPLWFKLPGFAVRGVAAKVTQRSLPIDRGFAGGFTAGAVQWRAPNPVWQSLPRTVTLRPSTGTAGLGYPLFTPYGSGTGAVLDYGIATAAPSAAVLTNSGNTAAPPLAVVTGPTAGFQLAVNGRIVAYTDTLAGSDTVTVDWATGRAYLSVSGSAPVDRTHLLSSRDFSGLIPAGGTATVTFAGTGGTAAVTTADLWR